MTHAAGVPGAPDARRLQTELQFVRELSEVVASSSELQPILDWIVQKTTGVLSADDGSIKLQEPGTPGPHTIIRTAFGSWPPAVSITVMGYLEKYGEALASPDLFSDPRFPALRGGSSKVRAVLAAPLKVGNQITGMLAVTQAQPGRVWTPQDAQLLTIVAGNSAGVIERARLRIEEIAKKRLEEEKRHLEEEKWRLERELNQAREVQMRFVPAVPLVVGPWQVTGRVVPAQLVGGDGFDYCGLSGGRLGLAITDVSGKGMPAALMMANAQAMLRAFCDGQRPIRDAIHLVNEGVARSAAGGKFVTLFYGEIDPAAGTLRYIRAGHNYPMLRRRDGRIEELAEGGPPLGVFEDSQYGENVTPFQPGDTLMLYSDGVSEAIDPRNNEFGEDRLRALWAEHGARAPGEVIDLLLERVSAFRGVASQNDDITVVVVGARGE